MEKYITKEEYRKAKGVDLDQELHDLDDASNKSTRFIMDVTDFCEDYLKEKYRAFELDLWPDQGDPTDPMLTTKRQSLFREGVIEQIDYLLENGNLPQNAGVNLELGSISDYSKVELSRRAFRKFRLAGFANV